MQLTFEEWAIRWQIPAAALVELRDALLPPATPGDGSESEAAVQAAVRVKAPRLGVALLRNNSGAVTTDDGRHIRFGLGNDSPKINKVFKSSDTIGLNFRGRFVALECKPMGWRYRGTEREIGQGNFLQFVRGRGGIGSFISEPAQLKGILNHG